ncbi:MAG: cytochrome c family protein, partial [Gammaproteobacteria bacterium]|nr:cytochrome c family protein [Gammaproteobacteria bacterium]
MTRRVLILVMLVVVIGFLGWRFIRPMNIFVVSEAFEKPINTSIIPPPLETLHAEACAACHREIYDEWRTTIHSQAWTDPYFQVDWKFDGYPQICKNCHIPLDRQQEHLVVGFRDKEKWQPILDPNPDF